MRVLAEDLNVGFEGDERAAPVDGTEILELARRVTALEAHLVAASIARNLHVHPRRKRVDDRRTDAVEPTRRVIDLAAELSAGVQRRHDDFERGLVLELRMRIDRDPAPVVAYRQDVVRLKLDLDAR